MRRSPSLKALRLPSEAVLLAAVSLLATPPAQTQTPPPTLNVTPSQQALTIHPGDNNIPLPFTLASTSWNGPVTVSLTSLPTGITASPITLTPGTNGTLLLSAATFADQEAFPANKLGAPNTDTRTVLLQAVSGALRSTFPISLTVSLSNPFYSPNPNNLFLPILRIDTSRNPITSLTTEVPGNISFNFIQDGARAPIIPNPTNPDASAFFRLYGVNDALMPKKSYRIRLNTAADLLSPILPCYNSSGPLGFSAFCDKNTSYILTANYSDKTLARDSLALFFANYDMPEVLQFNSGSPFTYSRSLISWSPFNTAVALYLNGSYEGTYELMEDINPGKYRLNIPSLTQTDTSPAQVADGGYILEIDHNRQESFNFTTLHNLPIGLVSPNFSPAPEVPEQTSYISSYVASAENALFSPNFTDPATGWQAWFDGSTAVNFYILNELMGNVDVGDFNSGVYLTKTWNQLDPFPQLFMGPTSSFDISAGNVFYEPISNPTAPWMQVQSSWYAQLFKDPVFKNAVVTQWNHLKNLGYFDLWLQNVPLWKNQVDSDDNFARWPMVGIQVWPNNGAAGSYDGEINSLQAWLRLRYSYLDAQFNGLAPTSSFIDTPTATFRSGSPVTLVALSTGTSKLSGQVSFFSNSAFIGSSAVDKSGYASITVNNLVPGLASLQAVYGGDFKNGPSASSLLQKTVLPPQTPTFTNLTATPLTPFESTLTAVVVPNQQTATPTGSVNFYVNGLLVANAPVAPNGMAITYATNQIPGNIVFTAIYSGDSNFQSSTSNPTSPAATP